MKRTERRWTARVEGLEDRNLLSMATAHRVVPAEVRIAVRPVPAPPITGSLQGTYTLVGPSNAQVRGSGTTNKFGAVNVTGTIQAPSLTAGVQANGRFFLTTPAGARLLELRFTGRIPRDLSRPIPVTVTAVTARGVTGLPATFPGTGTLILGATGANNQGTFQFRFNLRPTRV